MLYEEIVDQICRRGDQPRDGIDHKEYGDGRVAREYGENPKKTQTADTDERKDRGDGGLAVALGDTDGNIHRVLQAFTKERKSHPLQR